VEAISVFKLVVPCFKEPRRVRELEKEGRGDGAMQERLLRALRERGEARVPKCCIWLSSEVAFPHAKVERAVGIRVSHSRPIQA
jgi:hypothetical protein